jgi:glutamate 5-kinase
VDRIKGLKTSTLAKVLGAKPYDEVIHRDNLALLEYEQKD